MIVFNVFISCSRCDVAFFRYLFAQLKARPQESCSTSSILLSLTAICLFLVSGLGSIAQDADNIKLQNYYQYWRNKYFRLSQQVKGGAFIDYQDNRTTCSEAHGYGMLICVYMSRLDGNTVRKDFDALDIFRRQFSSSIDSRLMSWYVDDTLAKPKKTTCATDGDLDMAYALILASHEWKRPRYMAEAKKILSGIEDSLIRPDYSLRRGDWDQNQHATRLSDIMPTHFDVFAQVSNRQLWQRVKQVHYVILRQISLEEGVFPDFVVKDETGWKPASPNFLESDYDGMMYYNSCRVPWRLAAAAMENNDQEARNLLRIFNAGIGKVANNDFMAGYRLDGRTINKWTDGAFTAPHMCSLFVNQRKDALATKDYQFGQQETYYQDSIRLLSLCLVTGNTFTLENQGQ